MRKTKTVEVWACDLCGAEQSYPLGGCDECKAEICTSCQVFYEAKVTRWGSGSCTTFSISANLKDEGLRKRLCKTCGAGLEKVFRDAGFEGFSNEIIPV